MQSFVRKFFGRHLFLTNTGISFGLSGIGDLIEQKIESKQKTKFNINWSRTLHMSTSFGLTSGVLCHFWYNYLDKSLPGRGLRVVFTKIAWDQVSLITQLLLLPDLQVNAPLFRCSSALSASPPAWWWPGRWRTRRPPAWSVKLSSWEEGCTWQSGSSGPQLSL